MSQSIKILRYSLTSKAKNCQEDNHKLTDKIAPVGILMVDNKKRIMFLEVDMMQQPQIH